VVSMDARRVTYSHLLLERRPIITPERT